MFIFIASLEKICSPKSKLTMQNSAIKELSVLRSSIDRQDDSNLIWTVFFFSYFGRETLI